MSHTNRVFDTSILLIELILILTITISVVLTDNSEVRDELEGRILQYNFTYDMEEADRVWFQGVFMNTNNPALYFKLVASTYPSMVRPVYTEWQNSTRDSEYHKDLEFNIPTGIIKPNSTIYYQIQAYNPSTGITYPGDVHEVTSLVTRDSPILAGMVKSGEDVGQDFPWNWCHEVIWDEAHQTFYALTSVEKKYPKQVYTSDIPYDWEYQGNISNESPRGWTTHKGVSGAVLPDGSYAAFVNIQDKKGTGAALYTGSSFLDMELQGIALRYGENKDMRVNCRIQDFWFNETDGTWYCYASGSSVFKGTRTHMYLGQSSDLNFTGDLDPAPQYHIGLWEEGSWTDAGIYPPNVVWFNGRGFGGLKGYANELKPYDFDADLIFPDSPRGLNTSDFYSGTSSPDAYFSSVHGLVNTQRSVPFMRDGTLWMASRRDMAYNATGSIFSLCGFWANETVRVSPGANPQFHYSNLPTLQQFKDIMNVTVYVWPNEANITVNQLSGTPPFYGRIKIEGTPGDELIVHIRGLTPDTVYLHQEGSAGVNTLSFTDDPAGASMELAPDEDLNLFFTCTIR